MRRKIWLAGVFVLVAVASVVPGAQAGSVRLDPGFGTEGIARTPLPPAYDTESFKEIAVTSDGGVRARAGFFSSGEVSRYGPDGSLLAEETSKESVVLQPPEAKTADGDRLVGDSVGEVRGSTVSRYLPDGSPDTSFGEGGTASLPFNVEVLAALPSGKVLAAGMGVYSEGTPNRPGSDQVVVARLGSDGKLDPGFGEGGIVGLRREAKLYAEEALFVQGRAGEGAEVVTPFGVVALDGSGKLDPSFGKGGVVTTPGRLAGAGAATGEALLVAGVKSTVPGSNESAEGSEEFYVARYTAAGQPDPGYGGGSGVAVLAPQGRAQAQTALVEADGSVLIGGLVRPRVASCPHGYDCGRTPAVVRFTPAGAPDTGFGQGGVALLSGLAVRIGSSSYLFGVEALAARPGGGVFAAGESEHAAFVAAIGSDGAPVASFGKEGIVTKAGPHPAYSAPYLAGVDAAGDLFVVAVTDSETWLPESAVVLRYSPDGSLDRGYGEGGEAFVPPGAQGLAVAPDGSVFLSSASESTLTELTPAGTLDPNFGSEGSVVSPAGKHRFTPWTVVRLSDGDLLVGGDLDSRHGPRPAVYRYLPSGKIDRSFGTNGAAVLDLGQGRRWEVGTMAVDRQGGILLAGGAPRRHPHGCCTQAGMLIRLSADGRLDRSFGRGGAVLLGGGALTTVDGLAPRGRDILAAATSSHADRRGTLLFSVGPDGRLDRRFGQDGVARVLLSPHRKRHEEEGAETAAVFSTPHRILVVRAGYRAPLLSFSPRGRLERNFARHVKGLVPRRQTYSAPVSPSATLDHGSLVLAWAGYPLEPSERGPQAEVNLQRLQLR